MSKFFSALAWTGWVILMFTACSKPSTLGSGLLEQDQEDVIFTDTIKVPASTIIRDSVISYNPAGPVTNMSLGYYEDPIFGETKSDIFMQITPGGINFPVLDGIEIDSVILSLHIDSVRTLGNFAENLQFEVYEMIDSFQSEIYYSNEDFPTDMTLLGNYDGAPSKFVDDSVRISSTEFFTGKLVKIPLNNDLGRHLIDSTTLEDFDEVFFGLNLRTTNSVPTSSLLSVTLETVGTGITVYYSNAPTDTVSNVYQFLMSPIDGRSNFIERDISGTILEDALENPVDDSERLYIQGLSGPEIRLDLSGITDLGPMLVNSAFIDFTVADDDTDDRSKYRPLEQLVLTLLNDEDQFVGIDDFNFGSNFFGGDFDEDLDIPSATQGTYRLYLSDYIQKVVDGDEDPIVFLRALPKINSTQRSVLYGNGSADFAPKLELTFTRIIQ